MSAKSSTERTYVARWMLGGYLAFVAAIMLWPTPVDRNAGPTVFAIITFVQDLGWSSFGYTSLEVSANVLLFIPLGALLVICLPARVWWLAPIIASSISLLGEVAQLLLLPERVASLSDFAANSIGGVLGSGVWRVAQLVSEAQVQKRSSTSNRPASGAS